MVQIRQAAINPQLAAADYSQLTKATIRGLDQELIASKEKNARIRASLAEVTMNNRTSADAQAKWMGAITQNEELLESLNNAPPRIQKAYQKATQGRATLEDNSVISAYLGSIQGQLQQTRNLEDRELKNSATQAQIDQSKSAIETNKANRNLANIKSNIELANAIKGDPKAMARAKTAEALMGGQPSTVNNFSQQRGAPPVAAINTSDPNDPVVRPVAGVALPDPSRAAPAPKMPPEVVPQPSAPTPAPAPVEVPAANPDAPYFTDSQGNIVAATPEVVNSPEVAKLVNEGFKPAKAMEVVQANQDLTAQKAKYVLGTGNTTGLPTPEVYQSRLLMAGNTLDDSRKQTELAAQQGLVYVSPTSEEQNKRAKEFDESWEKESAALVGLIEDTQTVNNAAERVYDNLGMFTSGTVGATSAKLGLDFIPEGKSNIEMQRAISQLKADSALTTMQELKDNSKQGATGLGQVSVVEFTSLIDKASSIDQFLQQGDLEESVQLYVYERNKTAYKAYKSMVNQYGQAAINTIGGASDRTMSNILKDINDFETTNPVGIAIAARNGYYVEEMGLQQSPATVTPPGGMPSPKPPSGSSYEQSMAAGEQAFNQRVEERSVRNAQNKKNMGKAAIMIGAPNPALSKAINTGMNLAPKIMSFFGGDETNAQQYNQNISQIKTK